LYCAVDASLVSGRSLMMGMAISDKNKSSQFAFQVHSRQKNEMKVKRKKRKADD